MGILCGARTSLSPSWPGPRTGLFDTATAAMVDTCCRRSVVAGTTIRLTPAARSATNEWLSEHAARQHIGTQRKGTTMSAHLIDGEFQSDKYPTCPRGKVPLSVKDKTAQDLLWTYAQRRREVDAEFADDLETALRAAGYEPPETT